MHLYRHKKLYTFVVSFLISIVFIFPLSSCRQNADKSKSVIYMIGDGMGQNHIDWAEHEYKTDFNMKSEDFVKNHVSTFSLDNGVTDSAAGVTALATGYKTNNGFIGSTYEKGGLQDVTNLCEIARGQGKSVGIITTDNINGATPAGFSSHGCERTDTKNIFLKQIRFGPEILFGATPMDADVDECLKDTDYTFLSTVKEFKSLDLNKKKVIGAFDLQGFADINTDVSPSLEDMMDKAIEMLSKNKNGFFLVVEGAFIDKASHANDFELMVSHTYEFDKCVGKAKDFCKRNNNCTCVVTADHETGGLNECNGNNNPEFSTSTHTDAKVPVLAYGYGSLTFKDITDNTDVAKSIAHILGEDSFGTTKNYNNNSVFDTENSFVNGKAYS